MLPRGLYPYHFNSSVNPWTRTSMKYSHVTFIKPWCSFLPRPNLILGFHINVRVQSRTLLKGNHFNYSLKTVRYECLTAYGTWFLRHLHNRALFWGVETGVLSMRSSQIDDHTLFYYVWTVLTLVGLVVESAVIDWLTIDKRLSSGVNLIFFLCPLLGPTYKFTRQKFTQPKNCKFHHSPMTCLG